MWPWKKRPSPPLRIEPYQVPVSKHETRARPGIVVEEIDTSNAAAEDLEALRLAQSQTGFHRAWNRLTGQK